MLKLKNTRQIIIAFFIVSVIFFIYSDSIVEYVSTLHPILILLASTLLNPVYILLIFALFELYGFGGAIAGFLISTSADLISLPHIYTTSGQISQASYNLFPESTFWNIFPTSLRETVINIPVIGSTNLGTFLIYIVASTGLIILALMFAHKKNFKQIFMKSI